MGVLHTGAPDFEIMGDAAAIRGRIAVMRDRASDCERIAWSLQEISAPGWVGRAADRFHEHFKTQPDRWWCASATFGRAADAWEAYATALEEAQARAVAAKASYEAGVASVEAALAEQRWASEHPQHDALGFPVWDFSYHPERDTRPGEAAKEQAIADFNAAVGDTDAAGEALAQTLYELSERSPDPSWAPVHFARRAVAGIFDGVWGLLTMTYGVAAEALWDYGRYMLGWMSWEELMAKRTVLPSRDMLALRDAILADPKGFARKMVEGLLNLDGWADDPGAALGELVPGAVLAALSVAPGAGARAARLTAVIESLPVIGEGTMLKDIGVRALRGASRLDIRADGAMGRLSERLDDYLRSHGMEDLADEWKEKRLRVPPRSAEDLASRVPLKSYQSDGEPPPTEGLVDDVMGADMVRRRELVLGVKPDGTSYTYEEWRAEHTHIERRPDGSEKRIIDWPPNDGYDGKPTVYSSVADYVEDFGKDVDRIGHPDGNFLGVIEDGRPASFEERSLRPDSVNDHYYQYEFTEDPLPEGWTIKSGKAAPWGQQPGGATQLQIVDQNGEAVPVSRLIKEHILKGKESPVGFS
ncbi:TNT domain-containing protein [Actinomyces sp. oral taxon 180]|uniref:TNT domain-containing protein n=1 Tax=Actinomyces sp. oral taxon 180 TaxID=651609 RepID=UPI0002EB17EE|nr:TNT domain-containing protein [Actinomyces sp. oral taxon 180]